MSHLELSIIIPCLNEEKTLPIVLEKAHSSLKRLKIQGEVIVADNGSTDKSIDIAKQYGARVVTVEAKGYGNALINGINASNATYILMADADDSYNFEEIDDFIKYTREGYDLVMGTRLKGKIEHGAMPFLHRYLGTPVLTFFINLLFRTNISDCNCGMRCFTKAAFEKMQLSSPGMEFASEMIIKSGLIKLKIKEIPISFYKDKRSRKPHLRTWSDGWRHLKFIFLYSPTYLFLFPGLFLMFLGLIILLPLLSGPLLFWGKIFDYHSAILGSLLTILGYQTIITGLYAKAYAQMQSFKVPDEIITKFYHKFSLEKGIIIGSLLFLIGFGIDVSVLLEWIHIGYQNLQRGNLATFASTLIILGMQTFFSSFFLSILNLKNESIQY